MQNSNRCGSRIPTAFKRNVLVALLTCISVLPAWAQIATLPKYPSYPHRVFTEYFPPEDMDNDELEVLARQREASLEFVPESAFVVGIYPDLLSEYRAADRVGTSTPVPSELVLSELDIEAQTERRITLTANSTGIRASDDHLRWIGTSPEGDILTLHQLVREDHFGPFWGQLQTRTASYRVSPIPCDPYRYFYYRTPEADQSIPSEGVIYSFLTTRQDCWPMFSNDESNEIEDRLEGMANLLRTMPEEERQLLIESQSMRCISPGSMDSTEDWRKTMACEAKQREEESIAGRKFTFADRPVRISPEALTVAEKQGSVRATLSLNLPMLDWSVYPQKRLKKSDSRQRRIESLMRARVRYSVLGSKFVRYSRSHLRLTMDFTKAALEAAKSDLEVKSIHGPPEEDRGFVPLSN